MRAVEKLARLSKSLLLLTRIENKQFTGTQLISINGLLEERNSGLEEWAPAMNLTISMRLDSLNVKMKRELAENLVNNLFRNAVSHSEVGDALFIQTSNNQFIISNTGKTP